MYWTLGHLIDLFLWGIGTGIALMIICIYFGLRWWVKSEKNNRAIGR